MVTGASGKGTWIRLNSPPIEGRLTHGFEGLSVGHSLRVQLVRTDVERGYIDFKPAAQIGWNLIIRGGNQENEKISCLIPYDDNRSVWGMHR